MVATTLTTAELRARLHQLYLALRFPAALADNAANIAVHEEIGVIEAELFMRDTRHEEGTDNE